MTTGHSLASRRRRFGYRPFAPDASTPLVDLGDDEESTDPLGFQTLMERARDGDMSAWRELHARHRRDVMGHVGYLVGDANTAEQITQATFASAMVQIHSFDSRESRFSTWLFGLATKIAQRHDVQAPEPATVTPLPTPEREPIDDDREFDEAA